MTKFSTTDQNENKNASENKRQNAEDSRREANKLILVVDDFQDNREMYAEYLMYSGYKVEQASNGQEALEKTFSLLPDLVLMDLSLPGMDGWEATRRIKTDERTKNIPVIVLTGHSLARQSSEAQQSGCDGFVTKPCLPDTLLAEVRRILDRG